MLTKAQAFIFLLAVQYTELMNLKRFILIAGLLSFALLAILYSTDPHDVPSFMLILPFCLLFGILYVAARFYFGQTALTQKQSRRLSLLLAAAPCLLLVLQSVDQLTIRDAAMLIGFFGLGSIYIMKTSALRQ